MAAHTGEGALAAYAALNIATVPDFTAIPEDRRGDLLDLLTRFVNLSDSAKALGCAWRAKVKTAPAPETVEA